MAAELLTSREEGHLLPPASEAAEKGEDRRCCLSAGPRPASLGVTDPGTRFSEMQRWLGSVLFPCGAQKAVMGLLVCPWWLMGVWPPPVARALKLTIGRGWCRVWDLADAGAGVLQNLVPRAGGHPGA